MMSETFFRYAEKREHRQTINQLNRMQHLCRAHEDVQVSRTENNCNDDTSAKINKIVDAHVHLPPDFIAIFRV